MAKIRLKDATISIIAPDNDAVTDDGNFITCALKIGDGTLSWTENRAVEYVLDRGSIFHAAQTGGNAGLVTAYTRFGDETPLELSLDFIFDSYSIIGDAPDPEIGPIPLLKGYNSWASESGQWKKPYLKPTTATPYSSTSVLSTIDTDLADGVEPDVNYVDYCAPYCVDILASFTKICGVNVAEHYLFKYFRFTSLDYDLSAGQISVSGQCQRALATYKSTLGTLV